MKKIIIFLIPLAFFASCVDSLVEDDYNYDQKSATVAPPETLFTNALKNVTDVLTTPNVNTNNFRLYVQHWATTTYLQEPRYDLTSRTIPQALWQTLYRDVIADLKEAKRLLEIDQLLDATVKTNQLAQIEVLEVFAWSVLVNAFGDVPYTEAFIYEKPLPKYDDAATIYYDILSRLDAALALMNTDADGFGNGDLLYEGDMAQWVKFGNSLKLKLAMILADVDPDTAGPLVAAAAPNVFASADDNARFPYISSPPNNNPLSANLNPLYSQRQDYVIAGAFVDKMNALNDPRRPFYFTDVDGDYVGGNYGFLNAYADFSHVGEMVIDPEFEALLLDYVEVEFLLAEAVERGFIAGDAADHYNKAVTASILYWGGTEVEAQAYLAQPGVAYATAGATFQEKIGNQKWIALYNRGFDAWVEWKRLDYPTILPPSGGTAPADLAIPVRLIYPINEQTLNGASREAASSAIGGDLATTKLFWDVN
jgi:hypothetical protein